VTRVLILLGSNIDRENSFCQAALRLSELVRVIAFSPVYETEPVGDLNQTCFLNAAALIETDLEPVRLKNDILHRIEGKLGRVRGPNKNAPRTIDLDIVLYGDRVCSVEGRPVPDPDLLQYAHVAGPVADLVPDWVHPEAGETLETIAAGLPVAGLKRRPDIVLSECTKE
jgi:2-amino-4-hydroxy-6-hydroxymethyldihydropteridine diphosphokinase